MAGWERVEEEEKICWSHRSQEFQDVGVLAAMFPRAPGRKWPPTGRRKAGAEAVAAS